ncbi:hypothetical protein ANN_06200 [Periplaneta americana]|uniref:Uncharacterized protein n=1 Tax=Periplaneta americana TaxID=6978 RepID=A0ABQ8TEN2_PERAM|nr:hypothetical protein ANN_06200 [Periplaneta americana]
MTDLCEGGNEPPGSLASKCSKWIFSQLEEEGNEFLFQKGGAPPHWHLDVRNVLNQQLAGIWIWRVGNQDNIFSSWPPRSPDLAVCDFFLWGHIKNLVYIPPLPQNLQELQLRITVGIESISIDMLEHVWHEWKYRLDVCSVTRGAHIKCI